MSVTDASTRNGRGHQRAAMKAKLRVLSDAERVLRERGDTDLADVMLRTRIAWHTEVTRPRQPDDTDLTELLRWSPVILAVSAVARAVLATVPAVPAVPAPDGRDAGAR